MSNHDFPDDYPLLLRISEGDENAFRELFKKYAPLVFKRLSKFIISTAVKEDIVQETFLRVWLHRDRLPEIQHLLSWILRIAYNRTFTYLRDEATHEKILNNLSQATQNYTSEPVELNFLKEIIARAIDQLPPQQKKIYLLNREGGLGISQISNELNLSPQTIKNTLGLALKSIRLFIQANGYALIILSLISLNIF